MIMPAGDQAASLNLCKRCTTLRSLCILDHKSHNTERKIDKKEPEWLYECAKITGQDTVGQEDSAKEEDILKQEARDLRLCTKEFGQGVRQQRVRDKTKERAGTLPLALTTIRRVISPQTDYVVDMLE